MPGNTRHKGEVMVLDEYEHKFVGGTSTAYLALTGLVMTVHTVTRLRGSFYRSEPVVVPVGQEAAIPATMRSMAERMPLF
jgi:hypothetical protein